MFEIECVISSEDVIPPYNHVHHAKILEYLEQARVEYLDHIGFPLDDYLKRGIFIVLINLNVEYKREVLQGAFKVTCQDAKLEKKSLIVTQRVINPKGKLAVEAEVTLKFVCSERKRA